LANLKEQYRPKHPKYIEAQSQLVEWKKALARAVRNVPEKARASYESAKATELALEEAARDQETAALELNRQAAQYTSLAHEVESFRTLRTSLSMLGGAKKQELKTVLFTSALPEEGKTFCSLNYALSLAQQGLRTVIIDCDLRRPMVERTLTHSNQRGSGVTD